MPSKDKPRPPPILINRDQTHGDPNNLDDFFSRSLAINPNDFEDMGQLGSGLKGSVFKVRHRSTNRVLARKVTHLEVNPNERRLILQELEVLKDCKSPYIVSYFGACYADGDINLFMEYMDGRSFDHISSRVHRIGEDILSKVSLSVVKGLTYLKTNLNMLHRDIKPSNIVVNSLGQIKLCDLGVSGRLTESLAQTFIGTNHYMAPERMQGEDYGVQSDIWSLAMTLVELALGTYPIPQEDPMVMYQAPKGPKNNMAIFDLISLIINEPSPTIPGPPIFTKEFKRFVDTCLVKEPRNRYDLTTIMQDQFLKNAEISQVRVDDWVREVCVNAPINVS